MECLRYTCQIPCIENIVCRTLPLICSKELCTPLLAHDSHHLLQTQITYRAKPSSAFLKGCVWVVPVHNEIRQIYMILHLICFNELHWKAHNPHNEVQLTYSQRLQRWALPGSCSEPWPSLWSPPAWKTGSPTGHTSSEGSLHSGVLWHLSDCEWCHHVAAIILKGKGVAVPMQETGWQQCTGAVYCFCSDL